MELTQARRLGADLMAEHGLADWTLRFDRAKRRAGQCRHAERVISISAPLVALHDLAEVRETLLHEIAHALAGHAAGHGPRWRATALRIGSRGERCLSADTPQVEAPWVGTCSVGHTVQRHRRPDRVSSCRSCARGFSPEHLLSWTHHGRVVAMHPAYVAELAALQGGRRPHRAARGAHLRILVRGRWQGRVGRVVKVGRTRYHLDVGDGVVTVPMTGVEPA